MSVSVIIPSYNYAHFLPQCIESVQGQRFTDWELIIVDDASQDESWAVLQGYQDNPRMRIYRNPHNLGLYPNIVQGIRYAQGKYVKILMADDWLHPDYLQRTVTFLEAHPQAAFCSTAALVWRDNTVLDQRSAPEPDREFYPAADLLHWTTRSVNCIGIPSQVLIRRSAYDLAGGFDLAIEYCTEYDLWLRLLAQWDAGFLPEPLVNERLHPNNATKAYARRAGHLTTGEQMFIKLFAQHPYYKPGWRQQQVWLFAWENYWVNALRHAWQGDHTELTALLQVLRRRSYVMLWLPLLLWRSGRLLLTKAYLKMFYREQEMA